MQDIHYAQLGTAVGKVAGTTHKNCKANYKPSDAKIYRERKQQVI